MRQARLAAWLVVLATLHVVSSSDGHSHPLPADSETVMHPFARWLVSKITRNLTKNTEPQAVVEDGQGVSVLGKVSAALGQDTESAPPVMRLRKGDQVCSPCGRPNPTAQ